MKKYYFANCIVLILGIILCVIGSFHDGNRQIESLTLNKIVVARPESSYDKFQIYHLNKSFNQIDLQLFYTNITLEKGSKYKVELRTNRPLKDFKIENETLKIHQKKCNYNFFDHIMPTLKITVPEVDSLTRINMAKCESNVEITIKDLKLKDLSIPNLNLIEAKLNQVKVDNELQTKGGNITFNNCQVNNWTNRSKSPGTNLILNNSTFKNINVTKLDNSKFISFKIEIDNTKILGQNKINLQGPTDLLIRNSQLQNLNIVLNENSKMDVLNTQWLGINRIEANKSKLLFNKVNPDLDLKVGGKSVKIHYYSEVYQNSFGYNSNKINKFFLKGKNFELKVK